MTVADELVVEDLVDAHAHLWDTAVLDYGWLRDQDALRGRYDLDDLAAAADGDLSGGGGGRRPTGIVMVEADRRLDQAGAEVDWVLALPQTVPVLGVVRAVAIDRGDAGAELATAAAQSGVVGVRWLLQNGDAGLPAHDDVVRGVGLVGEHGLPFDLCVRQHQLEAIIDLADRAPGTTIVLDHLAKPCVDEPPTSRHVAALAHLGRRPNVVCKLSGLATEARSGPAARDRLVLHLRAALDAFGADRCLFGSDWPVSSTAIGYDEWLSCVLEATADLSPEERRGVFAGNARRVYGLAGGDAPC